MSFRRLETRLDGLVLIEPDVFPDSRGFFLETYREDGYKDMGIDAEFVQDNHSRSQRRSIRAFHFQIEPGQAKLVRAARGTVHDVAIDLRRDSPTYGQHEAFELSDENHRQLFVPIGFAHGFCVLSEVVHVEYKCTDFYDADDEIGLAWNDPDVGIEWPVRDPIVSEKDRKLPLLKDLR